MLQLTESQKVTIKKYAELYHDWLSTQDGQESLREHRDHSEFLRAKLAKQHIDEIDEAEFRELYKILWASNIWGNKDWYIENKLLKPNGLAKIKTELKKLLYGEEAIDIRIDNFWKEINGFGSSSLSEILHFVFPEKFCLWNDKPRTVLPFLNIDLLPDKFFKYQLKNGTDYVRCNEALNLVRNELAQLCLENPDFIDVDCMLWFIFQNYMEEIKATPKVENRVNSHDEKEISINDKIDLPELTSTLDKRVFQYSPHYLRSPERISIRDILVNAETRWILPKFQRYYDWKKEDIRAFLESIFNDYFVGSLLLWEIEKVPEVETLNIVGVTSEIKKPEFIILDGQQRITSLYYALNGPPSDKDEKPFPDCYFYVDFKAFFKDPSTDIIVCKNRRYTIQDSVKFLLFPLYEIKNYKEWIRAFEDYCDTTDGLDRTISKEMRRVIEDRIVHFWERYQIPYVKLPSSMTLSHVVDIFENINTRGKPLNTFDLLIAASLKHGVDLRELWENSLEQYPEFSRYERKTEKLRLYVVQAVSLVYHKNSSCKKGDLLEIFKTVYGPDQLKDTQLFKKHWTEMAKYVHIAIQKLEDLKDGFGVLDEKHVPFMPVIPILAALIREVDNRENKRECNEKIKQWYWSIVFNEAYSSAVDSQLTSDFKEMKEWFSDESKIPRNILSARNNIRALQLSNIDSLRSSVYNGVVSLLTLKGAKDLETGEMVSNRENYHRDHIFPKSKGSKYARAGNINSINNITLLTKETNERKRNRNPKDYFQDFMKTFKGSTDEYIQVLSSHIINKDSFDFLLKDDFEKFAKEREESILREIKALIGVSPTAKIIPEAEREIDIFEENIRNLINTRLSEVDRDYWNNKIEKELSHTIEERINQLIVKSPHVKRDLINPLNFCTIMDYYKIIRSNWGLFEPIFRSRGELEKHLLNISELRNAIKHSREISGSSKKLGEASIMWFDEIMQAQKLQVSQ